MGKHDFSNIQPYMQKEMTRFLKAAEQKMLYPQKTELEQLIDVTKTILHQLEKQKSKNKNLQLQLFGKRFTLNQNEQSTLKKMLNLNYQPLKVILETFDIIEDVIKLEMKLEIYSGIVSKTGKLIPRSVPTLILPFKEKHVTYNSFENWQESVKNPRTLDNMIYDIKKNHTPIFQGGNVKDFVYVNYPINTPLRSTIIPIALELYKDLVQG